MLLLYILLSANFAAMLIKETVGYSVNISGIITNAQGKEVTQTIRTVKGRKHAVVSLLTGDEYNAVSVVYMVHRLVAEYWLKKPNDGRNIVRHKDGNTLNNKAFNLEWVSRKDIKVNRPKGLKHSQATKTKISASLKGSKHPKFKGQYICNFKSYDSATEAARWLKTTPKTIISRCKGGKMKLEGWYFVAAK